MVFEATQQSMGGLPLQQETGVVGKDGADNQFGPATKEYYDASQWAMVPRTISSGEIIPDVDIEERKNLAGEPRLLKHIPEGDYLSNFLTICHAIAGARETMLMRDCTSSSYGQEGEWWRGNPISMPRIVHTDSGTPVDPEAGKSEEIIAEVQRLMAFLDCSDRSYASPGALTQTEAIKDETPAITKSRTLLEHFIQQWILAVRNKTDENVNVSGLFNTRTAAKSMDDDGDNLLFDLRTDPPDGEKADLTELMDGLLWSNDSLQEPNFIECPAEVLVIRVSHAHQNATQLQVDVPAELYLDKYLQDSINATMGMRQEIAAGKTRIKKIGEIEKKLTTWKHPRRNEQLDAKVLLEHAHGHFSGSNKEKLANGDMANGVLAADDDEAPPPHYEGIAQKIEKVIASIDNKLAVLALEKEKTRKCISDMSRSPLPDAGAQQRYRYTLRGVATKPNITYVLRPKEEDDDDEDTAMDVADDGTPEGMQWWRMEYEVLTSRARISKTKTPDYDVLRAAELEHREALLVYASDRVNDVALHDPSLPPPLQQFIDDDNQLFKAELQAAAENSQPPAYSFGGDSADVPRQSIERKGSMDSTRAEGGEDAANDHMSPPDYGQEEFMGHPGFGLGPIKQGQYDADSAPRDEDAPVHEIRLSPQAEEGQGEHVEMAEKAGHATLIPGLGEKGGDGAMTDMMGSQDGGLGGNDR